MPFKQVLGDVENALGKMHDWAGMGYDVNTYDEFFFSFSHGGARDRWLLRARWLS